ncbi:MAG: chlorophyll a/b binding light-harvesting protein, partial [Cyanobacteria bacterium P01_F01_bin.4]
HILNEPIAWAKQKFIYEGDAILSYSLAGVGLMAIISAYFVFNTAVYPVELFGAPRPSTAFVQIALGLTFLGGHVWHNLRAQRKLGLLDPSAYFVTAVAGVLMLAIVVTSFGLNTIA